VYADSDIIIIVIVMRDGSRDDRPDSDKLSAEVVVCHGILPSYIILLYYRFIIILLLLLLLYYTKRIQRVGEN